MILNFESNVSKMSQMCRKILSLGEKSAINKYSVSGKLGKSIPKGSFLIFCIFHHIYEQIQGKINFGKKNWDWQTPDPPMVGTKSPYYSKIQFEGYP